MSVVCRKLAFTILIAFVLSVSLINVHAATHLSAEVLDCELGSIFSDPPDGVAIGAIDVPVSLPLALRFDSLRRSRGTSTDRLLQARGPPDVK